MVRPRAQERRHPGRPRAPWRRGGRCRDPHGGGAAVSLEPRADSESCATRARIPGRPLPDRQGERVPPERRHRMELGLLGTRLPERARTRHGDRSRGSGPRERAAERGISSGPRGAGGAGLFGVVTRFHLRLHSMPRAIRSSTYFHPVERLEGAVSFLVRAAEEMPSSVELTAFLLSAPPALAARCPTGKVCMISANAFAETDGEAVAALEALERSPALADSLRGRLRSRLRSTRSSTSREASGQRDTGITSRTSGRSLLRTRSSPPSAATSCVRHPRSRFSSSRSSLAGPAACRRSTRRSR